MVISNWPTFTFICPIVVVVVGTIETFVPSVIFVAVADPI